MSDPDALPVSVVLPCYNAGATVKRAVESVAAQTARVREVIAVDDASTDETYDELRALQEKYGAEWLKVRRFDRNGGPSAARNAGWDAAQGEYVAFLDADDTWHARKIAIQFEVMTRRPDALLSAHLHTLMVAPADPGPVRVIELSANQLLWRNRFVTPSVMIRRLVAMRFRAEQRHMEDHLLWMRLALTGGRIVLIDIPLATLHKPAFGVAGLSADLISMERAELGNYRLLWREGQIGSAKLAGLWAWSAAKFVRRLALVSLRRLSS